MAIKQITKCVVADCDFVSGDADEIEQHLIDNPDHDLRIRIIRVEGN